MLGHAWILPFFEKPAFGSWWDPSQFLYQFLKANQVFEKSRSLLNLAFASFYTAK
uniref:Uncharacterized protein n=1 Tax=Arundo donax TaxID=35708 RepID=A0A0A9CV79_ARUDO